MDFFLNILQSTIPALIVFFTVYFLMTTFFKNERAMKAMELQNSARTTTIPMQLQAYERLSLLCERISIQNMVLRFNQDSQSVDEMKFKMLLSIQKEIEYNVTQQVYVGETLWTIIKLYREQVTAIVTGVAGEMKPGATTDDYSRGLLLVAEKTDAALSKAQSAIKTEASLLL